MKIGWNWRYIELSHSHAHAYATHHTFVMQLISFWISSTSRRHMNEWKERRTELVENFSLPTQTDNNTKPYLWTQILFRSHAFHMWTHQSRKRETLESNLVAVRTGYCAVNKNSGCKRFLNLFSVTTLTLTDKFNHIYSGILFKLYILPFFLYIFKISLWILTIKKLWLTLLS